MAQLSHLFHARHHQFHVGTLIHHGQEVKVGNGDVGPHTRKLRERLVSIQRGESRDTHGWTQRV